VRGNENILALWGVCCGIAKEKEIASILAECFCDIL
jgi:hypothetical protein